MRDLIRAVIGRQRENNTEIVFFGVLDYTVLWDLRLNRFHPYLFLLQYFYDVNAF